MVAWLVSTYIDCNSLLLKCLQKKETKNSSEIASILILNSILVINIFCTHEETPNISGLFFVCADPHTSPNTYQYETCQISPPVPGGGRKRNTGIWESVR